MGFWDSIKKPRAQKPMASKPPKPSQEAKGKRLEPNWEMAREVWKRDGGPTDPPGYYKGKHYTDWADTVKKLKREDRLDDAESLLMMLVDATEAESRVEGLGVAPLYYQQLAIAYRKKKELDNELEILERYDRQKKAPGTLPKQLKERLQKVKAMKAKQEGQ